MKTLERAMRRLRPMFSARPRLAFVLGSGFHSALDSAEELARVSYRELPGFPCPTVPGHSGELAMVRMHGIAFAALRGRAHYYEGCSMEEVTFPIRVLAALGVRDIVLTNAAGGISPKLRVGHFMFASDHINFMGVNPLRGATAGSDRFVDLTQVYDPLLLRLLKRAARAARVACPSGVYLAVSGPSYETPAEIRAFAKLGADAVGMSAVPEAIVARHCGLRVAAVSCITNLAAGRNRRALSHAEVLATGARVRSQAVRLLEEFIRLYARGA